MGNESRQPTPRARRRPLWSPSARRGCAESFGGLGSRRFMCHRLKLDLPLLALLAGAVMLLVSGCDRADRRPLSLTFQRYSDLLDPYVGDVGFFWLTNASAKPFLLCMTGGSNTLVINTLSIPYKGKPKMSYLVHCAFRDQTPQGWTNWEQSPYPFRGSNAFLQLSPHSGIVIRAPLPTNGQKRKVAVVCEAPAPVWQRSSLWGSGFGQALLRMLPRSVLLRLAQRQPTRIKVWCDQELSHPGERYPR
jgi:hypothetical protein